MKIILTADFLCHNKKHSEIFTLWFFKTFLPMIDCVIDGNVKICYDIVDACNNLFLRDVFFKLGGINQIKDSYHHYNPNEFNQKQIEYLSQFFNRNTIVIGIELYKPLITLLSSLGCKVIDIVHHPYKLFDDLAFGFYANDINVHNVLMKYQVPQERFYYYANYWKVFMQMRGIVKDHDLDDNSALFIGQTLLDKSVDKDGIYLNVTHYEEKLKELSIQYSKIYYLPHPYLGKKRKLIYDWVKKSPYIELLTNHSTYGLLASDKISKVVGISTSVLYEAKYFNKDFEYLFKPLFNVDVPFEEDSYVSIYEDYWNPKFWADILSPVCDIKNNVKDINYFKGSQNKIRNIRDMYWGYTQLDPIKRIPTFKESIKDLYRQYIAPLF